MEGRLTVCRVNKPMAPFLKINSYVNLILNVSFPPFLAAVVSSQWLAGGDGSRIH